MAKAQRARQTEEDTAFHREKVRQQDRTLDAESGSSPERDNHADESPPPVRVLPAGGTLTVRRRQPHIDAPNDPRKVTVLVPTLISTKSRCCHLSPEGPDDEKDTQCNQDGEYDEWTLLEAESHRQVRPCKMCFTIEFDDTLTPEGVFGGSAVTRRPCPNCGQNIPSDQHAAHVEACRSLAE
jgi:hypothetical protein